MALAITYIARAVLGMVISHPLARDRLRVVSFILPVRKPLPTIGAPVSRKLFQAEDDPKLGVLVPVQVEVSVVSRPSDLSPELAIPRLEARPKRIEGDFISCFGRYWA
jgi:hypothetical protein